MINDQYINSYHPYTASLNKLPKAIKLFPDGYALKRSALIPDYKYDKILGFSSTSNTALASTNSFSDSSLVKHSGLFSNRKYDKILSVGSTFNTVLTFVKDYPNDSLLMSNFKNSILNINDDLFASALKNRSNSNISISKLTLSFNTKNPLFDKSFISAFEASYGSKRINSHLNIPISYIKNALSTLDLELLNNIELTSSSRTGRYKLLTTMNEIIDEVENELSEENIPNRFIFEAILNFAEKLKFFIKQKKVNASTIAIIFFIVGNLVENAYEDIVREISPSLANNIEYPLAFMGIGDEEKNNKIASKAASSFMDEIINEHGYEYGMALVSNIRVVKLDMTVRSYKSRKANISGKVNLGYKVYVLETKGSWTKISYYNQSGDHIQGWVFTRYLMKISN